MSGTGPKPSNKRNGLSVAVSSGDIQSTGPKTPSKSRPDPGAVSLKELCFYLMCDSPILYLLVEALPPRPPGPGRPRVYPHWIYFLYAVAVQHTNSARRAAAEMRSLWPDLVEWSTLMWGPNSPLALKDAPLRQKAFISWRRSRATPEIRAALSQAFSPWAVEVARQTGALAPATSWSTMHKANVLRGDAVVIHARSDYKPGAISTRTGRLARADPDAKKQITGDGRTVVGNTAVIMSAIGVDAEPVVLAVEMIEPRHDRRTGKKNKKKKKKGKKMRRSVVSEGEHAANMTIRLYDLAPDCVRWMAWDGALRGTHIAAIQTARPVVAVAPVHMVRKKGKKAGQSKQIVKDRVLGYYRVFGGLAASPRQVHVKALHGAAHMEVRTEDGSTAWVRLPPPKIESRQRVSLSKGRHVFYGVYTIPAWCGGGTIRVHAYTTEADKKNGLNREECLRLIAPTNSDASESDQLAADDRWTIAHGLRANHEAVNNLLELRLAYHKLAHSMGAEREFLDVLAFGMYRNATAHITWMRRRELAAEEKAG